MTALHAFTADPLPRLLLQWGVPCAPAAAPVATRVGAGLGWADAIGLSQVLASAPGGAADDAARREARDWAGAALDRVQADLVAGFDDALLARDACTMHSSSVPWPPALPRCASVFAPGWPMPRAPWHGWPSWMRCWSARRAEPNGRRWPDCPRC